MTNVSDWLRDLGLGQYEAAFRDNDIDATLLPGLTSDDLKELGISSLGHRKRLLEAIAALRPGAVPEALSDGRATSSPTTPPAGAERRQLTVLFCDLVGSTALSARLDPEDLRPLVNAYLATATAAVDAHGGYVAKLLGDGVLAYFGWPSAREDDAERAVRAGLAALTDVARLTAPDGSMLAARVGIATGPVVVGEVLGEGTAAQERSVVGETPNLAARLQALAGPGEVIADDATRRLAGGLFEWSDQGAANLRGLPAPVHAWRAVGDSGVESRFEALRTAAVDLPLVGRAEELEILRRRWARARSGEGQVVLLRGEAGIGKSRLAAALREATAADDHEDLVLFCAPQHASSALRPIIARMERAAGFTPTDPPEARLEKLEALLLPSGLPAEDVSLIAGMLSVDTLGCPSRPTLRRERSGAGRRRNWARILVRAD